MNGKREIVEFLQRQNEFLQGQLEIANRQLEALQQKFDALQTDSEQRNKEQQALIQALTATIEELRKQIASLEAALDGKGAELSRQKTMNKALQRLQGSQSEQQSKPQADTKETSTSEQPTSEQPQKPRTNNGAKKKEHLECQVIRKQVLPDDLTQEQLMRAVLLGVKESIRYEFVPAKVRKVIYEIPKYLYEGKIYSGHAPATPLRNSQYTSSFIAHIAEMRYRYGMPIEAVVEHIRSHGFDLDKGTAQKLITKVKQILFNLYRAIHKAVIQDSYICGDETYYKVRLLIPTPSGKKVKKSYIWVFVGMTTKLVYFFYDDGSRSAQVFEEQIKDFHGTFQCDFYSGYRHIGMGQMSDITRIPCLQHIKRKFLDIPDNPKAKQIAQLFGLLYHFEHQHTIGQDQWTIHDHLLWRQRYSKIILERIHRRLIAIKSRTDIPPDDPLKAATEHALKQWTQIPAIFASPILHLDNNEVERVNRVISLARRRLTIGSHTGAETAVLYHSIVSSCQRCGVNIFQYLCDILDRCAAWPPTTPPEKYRELLPDRWQPAQ